MKKLVLLMAVLFSVFCLIASAEEAQVPQAECSLEDGLLVIRVPLDAEDGGAWAAWLSDEDEDRSVDLQSSETADGFTVFTLAPLSDGWDTVEILRMRDDICVEFYSFLIEVQDGAFSETPYMDHNVSPDEALFDPYLIGEWLEAETQFRSMEISDRDGSGWDVTVVSPVSHGAYKFTASVHYDCSVDSLLYTDGTLYDLPATGEEPVTPTREGLSGCIDLDVSAEADGQLMLVWEDPVTRDEVCFLRSDEDAPDVLVPEFVDLGADNDVMPDGVFWADINPDDLKTGLMPDVIFYTADVYSGLDIGQVTPGEMLFRDYTIYRVDSVNADQSIEYTEATTGESGTLGFLSIPGTDDFVSVDVSGSGLPTLTFQNVADTPLADDAALLLVHGSLETESVDTAAMAESIASDSEFEDCRTVVRIQDGRITEIRHYADVPVPEMMADVLSLDTEE